MSTSLAATRWLALSRRATCSRPGNRSSKSGQSSDCPLCFRIQRMKTKRISLSKRAGVTLLELDRDAILHPLYISSDDSLSAPPPVPEGMTHDQAVAVPGDYQTAFAAFQQKRITYNNAALVGWAADIDNIINFGDESVQKADLMADRKAVDELFMVYGEGFNDWTGNPIIDFGLKIIQTAFGLRRISRTPFEDISSFINDVYRRFGAVDDGLVTEAHKSEEGKGGGEADSGSSSPDSASVKTSPV